MTPDLLRSLPPNAKNFLTANFAQPLGRKFENPEVFARQIEVGGIPRTALTAERTIDAGARPNPEFEKAALQSRGLTQGAEALQAAVSRKLEEMGGDPAGLGPLLDKAAAGIDKFKLEQRPFSSPSGPAAVPLGFLQNYLSPAGQLPALGSLLGGYFNKDVPLPQRPAPGQGLGGPADDVGAAGRELAAAISEAAKNVRAAGTSTPEGKAGGGAIRGPGSSTSDSIPIMGSDGEYMLNAKSAGKIGLARLDYLNQHGEWPGYAAGGPIPEFGNLEVTPTDDGGAIINGNYVPPGSSILQDPRVKQALASARSARGSSGEGKKHKSDFVGIFGGHVFDTPGSYAKGGAIGRIGRGSIMLPGYADGGPIWDIGGGAPDLSSIKAGSPSAWPDVEHLGSMDLRHPAGDARVIGPKQTLRNMAAAARDAADAQTGPRPGWYRGKG